MELLVFLVLVLCGSIGAYGAVSQLSSREISNINSQGPYIGIVVPNASELNPILQSHSFVADDKLPYFDFPGGVLHYGIAGNANPELQIGDVTIPQYWAYTGLWNWQRFGDGPNDELALEANGDCSRRFGYLNFFNYNNYINHSKSVENLLNNVWHQTEEFFLVNGIPKVRQHAFWVPADKTYFKIARKLKNVELGHCVNTTCLPRKPIVVRVKKGVSANVFVDNEAYRVFWHSKFDATLVDMEILLLH